MPTPLGRGITRSVEEAGTAGIEIIDRLSGSSERLAAKPSSALLGIGGALFGIVVGCWVSHLSSWSPLPMLTPLTAGMGMVILIIAFRGPRRLRLERAIAERRLLADENRRTSQANLERIGELPEDAPAAIRDNLWLAYARLSDELAALAPPPDLKHQPLAARPASGSDRPKAPGDT